MEWKCPICDRPESLEKNKEWISVKDRLPKEWERIIFLGDEFYNCVYASHVSRYDPKIFIGDYGDGFFSYDSPVNREQSRMPQGSVSHWMPLPYLPIVNL